MSEFEYISDLVLKEGKSSLLKNIEWHSGDLKDIFSLEEALNGIETVFHCAGLVSFYHQDSEHLMKVNQEGTANLVNACLIKGIKKFCHISSTAAVGSSEENGILNEENIWKYDNRTSAYSTSKYLAEMEVWRGAAEGLNVVIINPSIIIGPGWWKRGTCRLFYNVAMKFPFYSSGSNAFVSVGDVCRAAIKVLYGEYFGERFLVTGVSMTFKDFLFEIADKMGRKRPFIKVGKQMSGLVWRFFRMVEVLTGKRVMITKESAKSSVRKKYYSSQKIQNRLDFQFTDIHINIAECAVLCKKWVEENEK